MSCRYVLPDPDAAWEQKREKLLGGFGQPAANRGQEVLPHDEGAIIAAFLRAWHFMAFGSGTSCIWAGEQEAPVEVAGSLSFGLFRPHRRKAVKDEGMPTYKNPPLGSTAATRITSLRESPRDPIPLRFVHGNLFLILTIEPGP